MTEIKSVFLEIKDNIESVSGLAGIFGIPDLSVTSALREAKINLQDEEDEDNEDL